MGWRYDSNAILIQNTIVENLKLLISNLLLKLGYFEFKIELNRVDEKKREKGVKTKNLN